MTEITEPNPAIPTVGYTTALELARAVSDAGGARADVTRPLIASNLGTSHKSGSFVQKIASAKAFGMIEGRGAFRLTANGKRYFFPADQEDKRRGMLGFLSSPPIFSEIIKRFDGNRISTEMLSNVMKGHMNVPADTADRLASLFFKSAATVGVIDAQGFLRFNAAVQSIASESLAPRTNATETTAEPGDEPNNVSIAAPASRVFSDTNIWVFSLGGQSVRIETSNDLSLALWRKLKGYVDVLRPANGEDE